MQEELADRGNPNSKRLVLGFDAGCFTCGDLAIRIEERVGEKLDVRNLRDPELQGWRDEALGKDAKWAPTLFEIGGDQVQVWTGWRMGWALSRAVGPAVTWQVMQALGEVGAAPKVEKSVLVEKLPERAAEAVVGMSRGQFLKGVGGAALAMSALSGTRDLWLRQPTQQTLLARTSPARLCGLLAGVSAIVCLLVALYVEAR